MLVLTRRTGQAIRIGPSVEVHVVRVEGDRVVLGIAAPRHIAVVRTELVEAVSGEVQEAADTRAKLRVMLAPLHAVIPLSAATADDPDGDPEDPGIA